MDIDLLTKKVLDGYKINKKEALFLYNQPLEKLCENANKIRVKFCSNIFDICTIINAKNGGCTEDCKFCAQSIHNNCKIDEYSLISEEEILKQAKINYNQGILRYSIVTSGRKLPDDEIDKMCKVIERIKKEVSISVCASLGLLNEDNLKKLKKAGLTRIHNNIETSKNNFPNICTTHTFEDKIKTIKLAKSLGLEVCSGGIIGLGENIEDRIDMAFTLRDLEIKSVPVNILNAIKGTPMENNKKLNQEEIVRIIAIYRFILPTSKIRLAGGRNLLLDNGELCFKSGANATISGNMLTTVGISVEDDMKMIKGLGYEVKLVDE